MAQDNNRNQQGQQGQGRNQQSQGNNHAVVELSAHLVTDEFALLNSALQTFAFVPTNRRASALLH